MSVIAVIYVSHCSQCRRKSQWQKPESTQDNSTVTVRWKSSVCKTPLFLYQTFLSQFTHLLQVCNVDLCPLEEFLELYFKCCEAFTPQQTHTHSHSPAGLPSSCVRCECQWMPQCVRGSRRPPLRSCHRPCPRRAGCPRWRWCPLEAGWSPGRRSCHLSAAAGVSGDRGRGSH